jgi:GT2 family glycosyltransferase
VRCQGTPGPPAASAPAVEQALREQLQEREQTIAALRAALRARHDALAAIETSRAWRAVRQLRAARDRVARSRWVRAVLAWSARRAERARRAHDDRRYERWVEAHTPTAEALAALRRVARDHGPPFSIVLRPGAWDGAAAARTLGSLAAQAWASWTLRLPPGAPAALRAAAGAALGDEQRVRGAWAPDAADAQDDFVLFLAPGDVLASEALPRLAAEIRRAPDADVLYSDEDTLDATGRRVAPFFKPDWSPRLLLSTPYLGQLVAYRGTLLREVGAAAEPELLDGYDLALRATERARRIVHVCEVLCHRADGRADLPTQDLARRALESALARRGTPARVEPGGAPAVFRVRYALRGSPLVSIVIPTKDHAALLRACVASVEARSTWRRREIVVVDNGSTRRDAVALLASLSPRCRVVSDPRPFNWAALNNAAAARATGEYLLFLNDDTEVLSGDWIEALLEYAQQDDVGCVGGKLLYPDRTVQHAGLALGIGVAGHVFRGLPADAPGYHGMAAAVREVSAVTGACLMVRRSVFEAAEGFDERLPVEYNDVDFCLRLGARGLAVVWTPHATLLHHESATRGTLHPLSAEEAMWDRWGAVLARDPYYSPHLTRAEEDYRVAG